ncbi:MAG: AlpA family phage regulatory protein [Shewanella fodinae]|nr:AlpA family phage regulatory protein [Shewanella fodinae]
MGLCKASVYNRINTGDFPKPVSIGGGRVAWVESDVDQWISERISAAENKQPRGRYGQLKKPPRKATSKTK